MIPEHLQTLAAVAGMIILTIFAASLVTSYNTSQQLRRMRIRQLVLGVHRLEEVQQQLVGIALPRDIRLLIRRDILARYRAIKRVHSHYPDIDRQIREARQKLDAEGPDSGPAMPVPPNTQVYEQWINGLTELVQMLRFGSTHEPVPLSQRAVLLQLLLERQVECLYGHHMNEVDKLKQEGREISARSRIQTMQDLIRSLGIHTPRVEELLDESEKAYHFLMYGGLPEEGGETAAAS